MDEQTLNVNEFMDRVQNDKELFFELLDIFVNDYYGKRKSLEEAIGKNDARTVEHVAHFLKGSCGNISAAALHVIFHELEKKGRDNDILDAGRYLGDIDRKFEDLMRYIEKLRVNLS